ncbi:hypothetical protein CCAX7_28380 [Capsulimonas corticalis]|uniref:Uncharacterized protein n=1 Tax=Capsulimonas corticalis TaxID=2219043 RepID=A0A402CTB0_9BACT|nr:hypothetical protein [Capsulimonas corticalis]BDI30787.1 hypothetical protein CCAX7_28380 [Capsulimonas corticalis]
MTTKSINQILELILDSDLSPYVMYSTFVNYRAYNDLVDAAVAEYQDLLQRNMIKHLDTAVAGSRSRLLAAINLFAKFDKIDGDLDWLEAKYWTLDEETRDDMLTELAEKKIERFAPMLNPIMSKDESKHLRKMAVFVAGAVRHPINLPTLLILSEDPAYENDWQIAIALIKYGVEEGRGFLNTLYHCKEVTLGYRNLGAWGLAKLGNLDARQSLIGQLETLNHQGDNIWLVAEAIADLEGWEFERHPRGIERVLANARQIGLIA